jgi:MFS family permease
MALLGLSALIAAYGPNDSTTLLVVVLFALGYGWNLAFVAGSSMLTIGVGSDIRSRLQGRVDSLTWTAGALASVSSGVIYQASDYRAISLIGLFLLVVPVVVMFRHRGAPLAVGT